MDDSAQTHMNDPDFLELISGKIEELRKRLIDGSRRNPLINVPFRANSRTMLRVVDELPDIMRYRLAKGVPPPCIRAVDFSPGTGRAIQHFL